MLLSVLANPGASTARTYYGIEAVCTSAIANAQNFTNSTFGGIVAVYVDGQHNGTGTVTRLLGTKTRVAKVSTGPVTNMFAVEAILGNYNATGAVTNAYGVFVPTPILTGSITNVYGLYIEALAGTNKWGVYQAGATDSNYLAGRLGVGINTFPTMTGVGIALGNLSVAPSTNPASGGVLYSEAGALKWRGSGGTVTTIAPA